MTQNEADNFEILYKSEYGGSGLEEIQIIDNQNEFSDFWSQTTFESWEKAPQIDFSKKIVIVKHFPSQNSGGTTYNIESISYKGSEININYTVSNPSNMGTTAITSPLIILMVDKVENPNVEFKNSNKN